MMVATTLAAMAQTKPQLVVNIVLAGVNADELSRYAHNLTGGGIAMLGGKGAVCSEARYDYQQTTVLAGAGTITTGTNPSMHGLISKYWIDYTTSTPVSLIEDREVRGLGCDAGQSRYSHRHIVVPTLGDELRQKSPESKVMTIAIDPLQAVAMGGRGETYWFNPSNGAWNSSSAYMTELPEWLVLFNKQNTASNHKRQKWTPILHHSRYSARKYSTSTMHLPKEFKRVPMPESAIVSRDFTSLTYTPSACDMTFEMARTAITEAALGSDEATDILTIGIDALAKIGGAFGMESIEREDALYRLDAALGDFIKFTEHVCGEGKILWVLTSANGTSSTKDESRLFNVGQFKVIINGFLSTQLGRGDWIVDCIDHQVYLNRVAIYSAGLNLADIQNRVAAFAMQFRGVSHVLSASAMQNGYFGESYGRKIQNSFYPRRSGDLVLNLMPGWIEQKGEEVASSGTMYDYDTHVPLIIAGCGIAPQTIDDEINICSLAPTIGRLIGIGRPIACEAPIIEQIFAN